MRERKELETKLKSERERDQMLENGKGKDKEIN